MTTTVEATSSELRELIARAQRGEEILVTLDGKVVSRISAASEPPAPIPPAEKARLVRELKEQMKERLKSLPARQNGPTIQELMDELREERL